MVSSPSPGVFDCTCRYYQKTGVCFHTLGIGLLLKEVEIPREILLRMEKVDKRRKKGAPRKTVPALQIQPSELAAEAKKRKSGVVLAVEPKPKQQKQPKQSTKSK